MVFLEMPLLPFRDAWPLIFSALGFDITNEIASSLVGSENFSYEPRKSLVLLYARQSMYIFLKKLPTGYICVHYIFIHIYISI